MQTVTATVVLLALAACGTPLATVGGAGIDFSNRTIQVVTTTGHVAASPRKCWWCIYHEGTPEQQAESTLAHLQAELRWTRDFAAQVVRRAAGSGLVDRVDGHLELTGDGRALAQRVTAR